MATQLPRAPSTVLIIGCGVQATSQAIFEKMYERGLRVVVVAHEDAWVSSLATSGTVEVLVKVPGLWDAMQTEELAARVMQNLADSGVTQVDAVFNLYYHYLLLSARIASRFGCVTNSVHAVETCIVKSKARQCLVSAWLESWQSFSFHTLDELHQLAQVMEYPAVLKPTESSGSYGVVKVNSPCDAVAQFLKLKSEPWLQSDRNEFILESYIDGPEFGVEIIMQNGEIVFSSIMDAGKQENSIFFQGTGRSYPSDQPLGIQNSILMHCFAAVKAIGLTTGVLDIDVRYSHAHGPRVIEVNPRIGGGSVDILHRLAYGVDLIDVGLSTFLGIDVAKDLSAQETSTTCFEAGWLMSPYSGVVHDISGFTERLKSTQGDTTYIKSITGLAKEGSDVVGYNTEGLPTCLVQVVTSGASKICALEHLKAVLSNAEKSISHLVLSSKVSGTDNLLTQTAAQVAASISNSIGQAQHDHSLQDSDTETVASRSELAQRSV